MARRIAKEPRRSRPLLPRALAQRKPRPGLPPTVALRTRPAKPAGAKPSPAAAPVTSAAPPPPLPEKSRAAIDAPPSNVLLLRGDFWELRYDGRTAMVEDCRGLRYIALLVQQAAIDARPLHARELVALATGRAAEPVELKARDQLLDDKARRQLLARLTEIADERDRAVAMAGMERAEQLDDEYERIAAELSHARPAGRKGNAFNDHHGAADASQRSAAGARAHARRRSEDAAFPSQGGVSGVTPH